MLENCFTEVIFFKMINIYVDESGSINNQLKNHDKFVVCLLKVNDIKNFAKF